MRFRSLNRLLNNHILKTIDHVRWFSWLISIVNFKPRAQWSWFKLYFERRKIIKWCKLRSWISFCWSRFFSWYWVEVCFERGYFCNYSFSLLFSTCRWLFYDHDPFWGHFNRLRWSFSAWHFHLWQISLFWSFWLRNNAVKSHIFRSNLSCWSSKWWNSFYLVLSLLW